MRLLSETLPERLSSTLTRRNLLRRATILGLSVPVAGTLLAACGDDDDSTATPSSSAPGGTTPAAGETPAAAETPAAETPPEGASGGAITIGINLEPDNLDPAVTPYAVSHTVMMNIYDPLVWRGTDGEFYPGLAESWEVSDDAAVFDFILRQDVIFHDGTPFNGEAVQKYLDRVVDPETASGFAANLAGPYERTDVTDDFTIQIHMSSPFAPFLDSMSQAFLGIPSPTAQEADPQAFLRNPVGTGFMRFREWAEADHITLERNEDYNWASPVFDHEGPAYLDTVTFRFYTDNPTRLTALQGGDVNMIEAVPDIALSELDSDNNFEIQYGVSPGVPIVMMLSTARPPTDDLAVRQAMNYALDRQAIVDIALFGASDIAHGPLSNSTPSYSSEVESYYAFDVDRAGEVLEEAGWTMGSGGIREKDGQPLTVLWSTADSNDPYAELIQAQMREAGIDVQLQKMSAAAGLEAIRNDDVNTRVIAWTSSDPVILTNLFHSKNLAGYNWPKVEDPALDDLLDRGEQTPDPAARDEIYAEAQTLIMDQALIVPIYNLHRNNALESRFQNVKRDFRTYIWLYDASVEQ